MFMSFTDHDMSGSGIRIRVDLLSYDSKLTTSRLQSQEKSGRVVRAQLVTVQMFRSNHCDGCERPLGLESFLPQNPALCLGVILENGVQSRRGGSTVHRTTTAHNEERALKVDRSRKGDVIGKVLGVAPGAELEAVYFSAQDSQTG